MTAAAMQAVVSPIEMNQTKGALLDLSLNHKMLLDENHRVQNLQSESEALI
jgi:hypothetical protein